MKLTDRQLEKLQLRPDRVEAIASRRKAINARRDERLYSTLPITDRLLDSQRNSTVEHRDDLANPTTPKRVTRKSEASQPMSGCGRGYVGSIPTAGFIFRRFLAALAYAAILTFIAWAVLGADGWWRR